MNRLLARLSRGHRHQDGWVVVTAIVLMAIMLGVGLAVLATADTQTSQSRQDRVRESAFNLAEGLMQAEAVVLQSNWPNSPQCATNDVGCGYKWTAAAPDSCTQATAASNLNQCPDPSKLVGATGAFSNVDQSLGTTTWKIQVRDDLGVCLQNPPSGYSAFYSTCQIPTYYRNLCPPPNQSDATKCWPATAPHTYSTNPGEAPGVDQTVCKNSTNASVACTWDANDNKQLWVRVDVTVGGKTRSMVALLHLEEFAVSLNSKDAVNGGAVNFSNNGNKNIVDATGSQIVTRCLPTDGTTPTTGRVLSTHLSANVSSGTTATIPATGTDGFVKGMVVALGADSGKTPPYELLTIKDPPTVSGANRILTFTTAIQYPHLASDGTNKLELAPDVSNNCQTWTSPPAPGVNGADKHQLDAPPNYKSDPLYPPFLDQAGWLGVTAGMLGQTSCPTNWNGNILIKTVPAGVTCTLPNGTINSEASPGFIFVENQAGGCGVPALKVSGSTVYHGLIYMRNVQGCSFGQTIIQIAAGGQIEGGVAVDGNAKVDIGNASNSGNCAVTGGSIPNLYCPTIKFDSVPFDQVVASGAAGLVQNTWRELAPGQ